MHDRIFDGLGIGIDDGAGAALGPQDLLPEGNGPQPLESGAVQLGPGQSVRLVELMAGHELAAESLFMLL